MWSEMVYDHGGSILWTNAPTDVLAKIHVVNVGIKPMRCCKALTDEVAREARKSEENLSYATSAWCRGVTHPMDRTRARLSAVEAYMPDEDRTRRHSACLDIRASHTVAQRKATAYFDSVDHVPDDAVDAH